MLSTDWGQPAKQSFIGRSDKSIGLFSDSLKPAKVQFSPGSGKLIGFSTNSHFSILMEQVCCIFI